LDSETYNYLNKLLITIIFSQNIHKNILIYLFIYSQKSQAYYYSPIGTKPNTGNFILSVGVIPKNFKIEFVLLCFYFLWQQIKQGWVSKIFSELFEQSEVQKSLVMIHDSALRTSNWVPYDLVNAHP
jgi:hypothetical protein